MVVLLSPINRQSSRYLIFDTISLPIIHFALNNCSRIVRWSVEPFHVLVTMERECHRQAPGMLFRFAIAASCDDQ